MHLCVRLRSRFLLAITAIAALMCLTLSPLLAQEMISNRASLAQRSIRPPKVLKGHVVTPASNRLAPEEIGKKMHTNFRLFVPDVTSPSIAYPPYNGYLYETPESIACLYGTVTPIAGCNPNTAVNIPTGGSQTIAIVDAFDNPTVAGDLAYFCDQMGIPFKPSQFHIVYASGHRPPVDWTGGWEIEAALDVEWAHAMAPSANIYLVEADSNYNTDLFTAVQVAANLVRCQKTTCPTSPVPTGKGEVSMSWGGSESSFETSYDSFLLAPNVVFLASAGDGAGTEYPAASPNVISVGGTSISRSMADGTFVKETAWQDTGGGPSLYESKPSYQSGLTGTMRATPDVSAVADPETGVWVYSSFPQDGNWDSSGWWIVGGTSAATPIVAGIVNAASTKNAAFAASSSAELVKFYNDMASTSYASYFNDITYGNCYWYRSAFAVTKYDICTGVGTPKTFAGK